MSPVATTPEVSLLDFTFEQLEARLREDGVKPIHAKLLWRALHRDLATDLPARADFLPPLRPPERAPPPPLR